MQGPAHTDFPRPDLGSISMPRSALTLAWLFPSPCPRHLSQLLPVASVPGSSSDCPGRASMSHLRYVFSPHICLSVHPPQGSARDSFKAYRMWCLSPRPSSDPVFQVLLPGGYRSRGRGVVCGLQLLPKSSPGSDHGAALQPQPLCPFSFCAFFRQVLLSSFCFVLSCALSPDETGKLKQRHLGLLWGEERQGGPNVPERSVSSFIDHAPDEVRV